MAVLSGRERHGFETRMLEHLHECFPHHMALLTEESARALIRSGTDRASHFGINSEPDVCGFISLVVVFGERFDENPTFQWARDVLDAPELTDPSTRVDRLYEKAMKWLQGASDQASERP